MFYAHAMRVRARRRVYVQCAAPPENEASCHDETKPARVLTVRRRIFFGGLVVHAGMIILPRFEDSKRVRIIV